MLKIACGALIAQNQFDSIDLSDNNVAKLEGFPKLHRLRQLLLNNNRVARIARGLEGEGAPDLGGRRLALRVGGRP